MPDEQNLERLLITGILRAEASGALAMWAESSTTALLALVRKHGWKRAFRIWNAALAPKSEAFVDALLQQTTAKGDCLAALRESKAWKSISTIQESLDAAPATP